MTPDTTASLRCYLQYEGVRLHEAQAISRRDLDGFEMTRALLLRALRPGHCRRPHEVKRLDGDPMSRLQSWIRPALHLNVWRGLFRRSKRSLAIGLRPYRDNEPCLGSCDLDGVRLQVLCVDSDECNLITFLHELTHFGAPERNATTWEQHGHGFRWLHGLAILEMLALDDRQAPGNPLAVSDEDQGHILRDLIRAHGMISEALSRAPVIP